MQQWTMRLPQTIERDGIRYHVEIQGAQRSDGTWEGRLRFDDGSARPLTTERETSQPDRNALEYWATGLEEIYLEGALQRARRNAAEGAA